jgi:hypothetical protein
VAAPLSARAAAWSGALLAAALLVAMALTGAAPELASMVRFEPAGVMAETPEQVTAVELRAEGQTTVFVRAGARWLAGGTPLPEAAAEHLAKGLRFLHVSKPTATLDGDGLDPAEIGLDAPRAEVTVLVGDAPALAIAFGGLNPSASAQYARLGGQGGIVLLPLHVGREWQVLARAVPDHVAHAR